MTCREGCFRYDFGDGEDGGLATEDDAMSFVQRSLPRATALIINADALRVGSLPNWDDPESLTRCTACFFPRPERRGTAPQAHVASRIWLSRARE